MHATAESWLEKVQTQLVTMPKSLKCPVDPEAAAQAHDAGKTVVFTGLEGLMQEWDDFPAIRERCRSLGCFVLEAPPPGQATADAPSGAVAKTVANTKYNHAVLIPVLRRMQNYRFAVPDINVLCAEVTKMMQAYGFKPDSTDVSHQAWSIRYLYGKVKGATYKETPPRESCLKYGLMPFLYILY